jgi:DNA-binding CsgD family transcriptional regulator
MELIHPVKSTALSTAWIYVIRVVDREFPPKPIRFGASMRLRPVLAFASFVLFLHAFPMSGYLMDTLFAFRGLDYFLPPLIIASLALPLLYRQERFGQLCRVCTFIVTPAPLLFTAFPGFGPVLLVLSGFCTPIVLLNCVLLVGQDRHPLKTLAFGIALGNVILAAFLALPAAPILKALSVSLLLAAALPMRVEHSLQGAGGGIGEYLPFIAAFFFVSGLLYGYFLPEYDKLSFIPGIEIAVYISAVLATVWLSGKHMDLPLVLGVVLAMFAMTLFQVGGGVGVNAGMGLMQVSAGMIDLFVFSLILTQANKPRAMGLASAAMGLGIFGGELFTRYFEPWTQAVTIAGDVALVIAIAAFFLRRRGKEKRVLEQVTVLPQVGSAPPEDVANVAAYQLHNLPPGLRAKLSVQERRVLQLVLHGKPFSEVAMELAISQSSVKTYMKRIYDKVGVTGKEPLLDILEKGRAAPPR